MRQLQLVRHRHSESSLRAQTVEHERCVRLWHHQGYPSLHGPVCHPDNVGLGIVGVSGSFVTLIECRTSQ